MANIEWRAEQVCSDCGQGVFVAEAGIGFTCTECGHVVQASDYLGNLGERERLEWHTVRPDVGPTLHVTAYGS
jgi:ribosomal protein S27AE